MLRFYYIFNSMQDICMRPSNITYGSLVILNDGG